jgi:hypothetical protein
MKYSSRFLTISLVTLVAACAMSQTRVQAASATTAAPDTAENKLIAKVYKATGLLFGQQVDGTMKMACTVTAFERNAKDHEVYLFATAAHCLATDDKEHEKVELEAKNYFITFDEPGSKNYYEAKILAAGYQSRGDDFAVLEVRLPHLDIAVVPLAKQEATLGEPLINIASPGGYGKQLFTGHISSTKLDRPVMVEDINWKNALLIQMSSGGGSSGSSLVSVTQEGIVAFLVGHMSTSGVATVVAIPASRFQKFWGAAKDGKYKWFKPESKD